MAKSGASESDSSVKVESRKALKSPASSAGELWSQTLRREVRQKRKRADAPKPDAFVELKRL